MNNLPDPETTNDETPGYPVYPPGQDIYARGIEVSDLDPEDLVSKKAPNERPGKPNEKNFGDDMTAEDLDIPGNEDDEDNAGSGREDEENNYYSLGGDDHTDLDEVND